MEEAPEGVPVSSWLVGEHGQVPWPTPPVRMADGGTQLFVACNRPSYIYNGSTKVLAKISDCGAAGAGAGESAGAWSRWAALEAYRCAADPGALKIDRAAVAAERRLDGKWVITSNDDTLTAEDLALGYEQLMRVEECWRVMKSGLRTRPMFHWRPHRISAHISLCVLALLLERMAEIRAGQTWRCCVGSRCPCPPSCTPSIPPPAHSNTPQSRLSLVTH